MDGGINDWNVNDQQWNHLGYQKVALKCSSDSSNSTVDFLKEVELNLQIADGTFFIQCLEISQDPQALNYTIVMELASEGSLRTCLNVKYDSMSWQEKIMSLWCTSRGLYYLHYKNLIRQNFHPGNILYIY